MVLSSVERHESPYHTKQLKDVQDLLANRSVDFAMNHEHEKSRMQETTNEMTSHVSSLNIGSEEMPIEEYTCAIDKRGIC